MYGHYFRNLDDKNRVVVPSKFKNELGKIFYATIDTDRLLTLRDQTSFDIWKDKLLSANMLNANARNYARLLLGNTIEVSADKLGRISFPEHIIKLAKLTKEVAFVGVGNKVELWDKKTFDKFQKDHEGGEDLDALAKQLLKDGVEL